MSSKDFILLIEDNPDDADLIRIALRELEADWKIVCIDTKPELEEILVSEPPDLVISDFNLPSFDAIEALKLVRAYDEDLPFILCSGYIGEKMAVKALRSGATDYVFKDNLNRLAQAVTRELKNYQSRRESRNIQRLIEATFNHSGLHMAILDDKGNFEKVNEKFVEMTGYSEKELSGMNFDTLFESHKDESFEQIFSAISDEEEFGTERKLLSKNGKLRYLSIIFSQIKLDKQIHAICYVRDITELIRLKTIHEQAGQSTELGSWELDLTFDKIYYNGRVGDIFDLSDGADMSLDILKDKMVENSRQKFDEALNKAIKQGISFEIELRTKKTNNAAAWIKVTGVPDRVKNKTVHIHGIFKDITEKVERRDELEKLSLIANKTRNGVMITDSESRIEWVNEGFTEITGYSREESVGQYPEVLLSGNNGAQSDISTLFSTQDRSEAISKVVQSTTNNEESYWNRIEVMPILNGENEVVRYFAIFDDISEIKQREIELKRAHRHLKERVKEKDCLYEIISLREDRLNIDELLSGAVQLLPAGWQYPEITEACIEYEDNVYTTGRFEPTEQMLTTRTAGDFVGKLKITVSLPETDESDDEVGFIEEEEQLLEIIAGHLVHKIEYILGERKLKKTRELMSKMSRLAKVGYWELDLEEETVVMSKMTKEIHEVDPEFTPSLENALTFYPEGEHRDKVKEAVAAAIADGTPYDVEVLFRTAKGREIWVRAIGEPQIENGECVRLTGSFQDIDNRKRAQIASDRNQKLLRGITDHTNAAIWVRNEEGRHIFVNKEWKRIFGLEGQKVVGKTLYDLLDPKTAEQFQAHDLRVIRSKESDKYEESIDTPHGKRYYLTDMFSMLDIPGLKKTVGGIATDITEQKELEQKLRLHSRLLEEVGEAVIATDPEGTIIYWNRAAEQIYGWSSEETEGENILEITPSLGSKALASDIWNSLQRGENWTGEIEVQHKDGSTFPAVVTDSPVFDDQGELLAVIGVSSDITERKRTEEKIRQNLKEKEVLLAKAEESSEKFKDMFEYAPSAITMLEGPEHQFIYHNKRYQEVTNRENLIGKTVEEAFPEFREQGIIDLLDTVYENGEPATGNEQPAKIRDQETGNERTIYRNYIYQPLKTASGRVYAILVEITDVTDQVLYQKQLKKSLEEKDTLLAEIHHRVKNNLAIVSSLLALQQDETGDKDIKLTLQRSENRIYSIAMVHELLYQSESFTDIPFKTYLERLVDAIRGTMESDEKDIDISIDVLTTQMNINQAVPLGLLFNELVTNSFKYAFEQVEEGSIAITITEENGLTIVTYEDDGPGFSKASDFETPESLGLTLVHTLLKQLEAEYTADTAEGFKLVFRFEGGALGSHSTL